ncbi:hypothetical protein SAMN05216278_0373 [Halopelagius longus]|uniref:Uncharacterized protein n=1 Tax=Halopelagius longus TaxID=1236180 RepID=A0A1H0Y366_9EURY|nr:hypothetical protein SAMN05216278_0373 [Halopelagius longus]
MCEIDAPWAVAVPGSTPIHEVRRQSVTDRRRGG